MFGFVKNAFTPRRDHGDCSGCGLCMLVCPVWRKTGDISMTPHGRAKAMQHGDAVSEKAVENCTLCMACNPVCPEEIDHVAMMLDLRRKLAPSHAQGNIAGRNPHLGTSQSSRTITLLPDTALRAHPGTLARVVALLGGDKISVGNEDFSDISLALETGADIPAQHLENFLAPLRSQKKIIVSDGLLLRHLKQWLPQAAIVGLGEALSGHAGVRRNLRATDLYVIEARAYHSDYQRLVKYYDRMRAAHGCSFNLDLQRIAIPAAARSLPQRLGRVAHDDDAQARWMLHGRNITRIVVESLEDRAALEKVSSIPVVHLAELADDGAHG